MTAQQYESPTPLIHRAEAAVAEPVPATWCVVVCEQGCDESWTVDTADFDPPLNAGEVERMLTPLLLAHEGWHRW